VRRYEYNGDFRMEILLKLPLSRFINKFLLIAFKNTEGFNTVLIKYVNFCHLFSYLTIMIKVCRGAILQRQLCHCTITILKCKIEKTNWLKILYWVIQNDCGQVWQLCTKIYVATVWVG
jgi:hypothetical protein